MDFNINLKAFLKQLPLKTMSGHQKFLAVAALQCKADVKAEITTKDIQHNWRRSLLKAKYNPSFYDRAQSAGWVDPLPNQKGKFRVTQSGLDNLSAMAPDLASGELTKSGSLIIVNRKATHTFDKFLRQVFAGSKNLVLIADSYVDETIFDNVLDRIPQTCLIKLMYAHSQGTFDARVARFSQQYQKFYTRRYKQLHDRFMIVDDEAYILGPSIKDAASNSPALVIQLGTKEKGTLQAFFTDLWSKAK
jgi:hypothetical protein